MYAGNIVEVASVSDIFKEPLHPYTKGLFEAIPKLDTGKNELPVHKGFSTRILSSPHLVAASTRDAGMHSKDALKLNLHWLKQNRDTKSPASCMADNCSR